MHEADKLAEAEYFLRQMLAVEADRLLHKYNFSAFLSASRSVMLLAKEEVNRRVGAKRWYDRAEQNKYVKFFRKHRNLSVHVRPVSPSQSITVQIQEYIFTGMAAEAFVIRDGKILYDQTGDVPPLPKGVSAEPRQLTVTMIYKLNEWPGSEDLHTLCKLYLDQLKTIVVDGKGRGYLTP